MYKVAVLGDKDSVYGFAALGLSVFFADKEEEAKDILRKLTSSDYSVIYITEQLALLLEDEIEKFSFLPTPAIILIPGISGNTGKGMESVKKSVGKAVGSDIISDV